jgi:hypothetical protein
VYAAFSYTSVCLGLPRDEKHGIRVGQYLYFCTSKRYYYTFVLDTWCAASCWEARYFFFLGIFFSREALVLLCVCPHNADYICVRILLCPHTPRTSVAALLQLCCSSVAAVACSVAVSAYCCVRIRLWEILGLTLIWALALLQLCCSCCMLCCSVRILLCPHTPLGDTRSNFNMSLDRGYIKALSRYNRAPAEPAHCCIWRALSTLMSLNRGYIKALLRYTRAPAEPAYCCICRAASCI